MDEDCYLTQRVCEDCFNKACDIKGQKLSFGNTGIGGGFEALYTDTGKHYHNHYCWIGGIKCWADESRFSGILIIPEKN